MWLCLTKYLAFKYLSVFNNQQQNISFIGFGWFWSLRSRQDQRHYPLDVINKHNFSNHKTTLPRKWHSYSEIISIFACCPPTSTTWKILKPLLGWLQLLKTDVSMFIIRLCYCIHGIEFNRAENPASNELNGKTYFFIKNNSIEVKYLIGTIFLI